MNELSACPFCGSSDVSVIETDDRVVDGLNDPIPGADRYWSFVECGDCGAQGPKENTEAASIDNWNRRTK